MKKTAMQICHDLGSELYGRILKMQDISESHCPDFPAAQYELCEKVAIVKMASKAWRRAMIDVEFDAVLEIIAAAEKADAAVSRFATRSGAKHHESWRGHLWYVWRQETRRQNTPFTMVEALQRFSEWLDRGAPIIPPQEAPADAD